MEEQAGMTLEEKFAKKKFTLTKNKNGTFSAKKKNLFFTRDTMEELFQVVKAF